MPRGAAVSGHNSRGGRPPGNRQCSDQATEYRSDECFGTSFTVTPAGDGLVWASGTAARVDASVGGAIQYDGNPGRLVTSVTGDGAILPG